MPLDLGLAHLGQMIDRALAAASQTRPERAFDIQRDYAAEEIHLRTDADRLVQVFINLISNARKYCDAAAPVLRIAVRQKGGRVVVDFIDNGAGIAKDARGLIFEKFARLTDDARAGGAGLGSGDLPRDHGQSGRHCQLFAGAARCGISGQPAAADGKICLTVTLC